MGKRFAQILAAVIFAATLSLAVSCQIQDGGYGPPPSDTEERAHKAVVDYAKALGGLCAEIAYEKGNGRLQTDEETREFVEKRSAEIRARAFQPVNEAIESSEPNSVELWHRLADGYRRVAR